MKYRLGLDIGTASVGLVALELDNKDRPVRPVYHSVRIFSEPLLPPKSGGVGETKRSARRAARQQRKGHMRRARLLERIAKLASSMDVDSANIPPDKGQRIHKLRAKAATSEICLEDLLLVFLNMAKRRGYYGGFKIKKDKEAGQVESGINNLRETMRNHGCSTLGEYLWHRIQHGEHLRLKEVGLFADREMIENEFNRIWNTQEKHHPVLKEEYNEKPLREHFYKAIVMQRPLKSPAVMVGNCSLEPMLPRAPMAQPLMQIFRIEKQIADLRWGTTRRAEPLSLQQREVIRKQLHAKKEVKFSALYRELEKNGCPGPEGRELNLTFGDRQSLTGNRTVAAMKSLNLLTQWNALAEEHQINVISLLAEMGSPEVFDMPEWDKNLKGAKKVQRRNIKPEVKGFIDEMMSTGKFDRLSKMGFDSGRASYSLKALKRLVSIMQKDNADEYTAIDQAYPHTQETTQGELEKDLPPHQSTGNVVIDVALGQVRREINAAIAKLGGPPHQIIVELSRDMRMGLMQREKSIKRMRANEKRRKEAALEIEKHLPFKTATESRIRRYLLWEEQGKKYCPYCERHINFSDALNGNETNYEHILPEALTRIGKKRDFLVLAHNGCNQQKKKKTPWQAWGHDEERWNIIKDRAEQFEKGFGTKNFRHKGKARQLLIKDYENEALNDEIIGDFVERQFQETAWIAKACGKWLRSICADVSFSRGILTAHLRRIWKLETVIPEIRYKEDMPVFDEDYQSNKLESKQTECEITEEDFDKYRPYWEGHRNKNTLRTHRRLNKRVDHRHHLVDALVIALTTRSLYQKMALHYKQVTESGEKTLRLYAEPEMKDLRKTALGLIHDCQPSHRPDRWLGGNMFKDKSSVVIEENGERIYAQHKNLADLALGNTGNVVSVDTVRNRIEKIMCDKTRGEVSKEFESRLKEGCDLRLALEKIHHPHWNTPIKRVLIRGNKAVDPKPIKHGNRAMNLQKYLEPTGYAYLEFTRGNPNSRPRLIRLHDAINRESPPPGTVRLYKQDTVLDSKDRQRYVIQKFIADGPSLFLSPVTEAIADVGKVRGKRQRKVSGKKIIERLTLIEDERA
ncbi:MAG: type II CRISPR RNA-guided endonuclease Cas9 [Gammaproteobacteria bacterium]|nr:type II CRISPR RNA-guided endonuclease Cas9 [Gammaproteobacteria bacterium]